MFKIGKALKGGKIEKIAENVWDFNDLFDILAKQTNTSTATAMTTIARSMSPGDSFRSNRGLILKCIRVETKLSTDEIKQFKSLFTKFCENEQEQGRCTEGCANCGINAACAEIFDRLDQIKRS